MKLKTQIQLIFLLFYSFAYSQMWVNDLEDAKKLAKATNKFIILDFNAIWCKPCRDMENEFWNNKDYKATLDKFIVVPIDIDSNKEIARYYSVISIPNVKVIDINGGIIHEMLGFSSSSFANSELAGFPETAESLYENLNFKDKKNPTDEELLTLANEYELLLQKSKGSTRMDFFKLSNNIFDKCIKKTSNPNYKELSTLGKLFNYSLIDSNKKVIKNLDISKISDENKSFAHYILAKAFFQEKQYDEAKNHIGEIKKINIEPWLNAAIALENKYAN